MSPDGIADPTLEGADGLLAGLALGLAAQVVSPSRSVVADLGDGDHVDGVIQGSVPSRIEAVADPRSARRLDGGGCVAGGELVAVRNRAGASLSSPVPVGDLFEPASLFGADQPVTVLPADLAHEVLQGEMVDHVGVRGIGVALSLGVRL